MRLYVARESTGRFFVVLRPLFFGGEIEGLGRLKGDLDLAGEELRGGFLGRRAGWSWSGSSYWRGRRVNVNDNSDRTCLVVVVISPSSSRKSSGNSRYCDGACRGVEHRAGRVG